MRLSTRGRYAVTAMLDLAIHAERGPVSLTAISQCQAISLSYLEQLFSKLRRAGLVEGVRGPGGGYRLARAAEAITVAQVIRAVDEIVDVTRCHGQENCDEGERCLTHELWAELSSDLLEFLDGITLHEFVGRPEIQAIAVKLDREHHQPLNA